MNPFPVQGFQKDIIHLPDVLARSGTFSPDEIHTLLAHTEVKTFPTYSLLTEREAHPYLMFVETGLLREFSVIDHEQGDTLTHHFVGAGDFYCGLRHFLPSYAIPSEMEVLERATVWCIKKEELEILGLTFPSFQKLTQFALVNCLQRYDTCTNLLKQPAEQRLLYFYEQHPHLANRISLKHLASYLNMTPTHLSRIRSKLASHSN